MLKFTANYAYTNPNFVIQNIATHKSSDELHQVLCIAKNILQRGYPTMMSQYLQDQLSSIHLNDNFKNRLCLIDGHQSIWGKTIKGDVVGNYYPAKEFYQTIIPRDFGEYAFVQPLIIPEIEINEIVAEPNDTFVNQQVDFYLPQAQLVIEIDGQQHQTDEATKNLDQIRDNFLNSQGITTIRINTDELKSGTYFTKIEDILTHLKWHESKLCYYRDAYTKMIDGFSDIELNEKLTPTAIIRFEILILELIKYGYLKLNDSWNFNILCTEPLGDFVNLAVNDVRLWIEQLWLLQYKTKPNFNSLNLNVVTKQKDFKIQSDSLNIDFSLFKRYTDEAEDNRDIIFVRTDYFDDKNYFTVSTATPINYRITDDDMSVLEFFLKNLFGKDRFKDGQFSIIANVLNREDTIGLLPTGGGKSLCYQLPCLLQPSINFVVCPIKSLMYDQKDNLKHIYITNVDYITSDLYAQNRRRIESDFKNGKYLFVWISPEKLQIQTFRDLISSIVNRFSIAYAVIDEVHCLSEWGHDFRISYLNLAKTIAKLSSKDENGDGTIKFIGLTATASVNVLKDIKIEFSRQKQQLKDENIKSLLNYSRDELKFEVITCERPKFIVLQSVLDVLVNQENLTKNNTKAALIFTPHINGEYGCYHLAQRLNELYKNQACWFSGENPTENRSQMPPDCFNNYKQSVQSDFKNDKKPIMVCTKAFGMGIDKRNIYYTIHYGLPSSVEALYQEAGRAGRWASGSDNKGICYVLYTPEFPGIRDKVDRLFHKNTTFEEISKLNKEVGQTRQEDVFRQMWLFCRGRNDIEIEYRHIANIVNAYYKEKAKVKFFWKDSLNVIKDNYEKAERAIYRLTILGIVSDWTTNYAEKYYEVEFNVLDEECIVTSVAKYINKYDKDINVRAQIDRITKPELNNLTEKSTWFLLVWTFENITYNRKQALKTLYDWCSQYKDSETFKNRIDSYFTFTDTTFIIQHITENPLKFEKWFEVLTINDQLLPKAELATLKDRISRFLESFRNSVGLNFISGFVRLALDDYDDSDGRERFESSLLYTKDFFEIECKENLIQKILSIGYFLAEKLQVELCLSIARYYPEQLGRFADAYHLDYLINEEYSKKITKFRTLNIMLYEQLTKI